MKLSFWLLVAMLSFGNHTLYAHGHHHHHHDDDSDEEGCGCQWTQEKTEFAQIQVAVAGPGVIQNYVRVAGKIVMHPDHFAYVTPCVNGVVKLVRKNVGDLVEQGEVLAIVQSRELAEAKAHYLAAQKKWNLKKALLRREEALRKISVEQDYLNAQFAAEEAAIDVQLAIQNLYAIGLTEDAISRIDNEHPESFSLYEVRSPLRGKVLQRNLTLGEITDLSAKMFAIGNFDQVWVEMNVAQNDIGYLQEGQSVEILAAYDKQTTVRVCQFNPTISEETRTATAFAALENLTNSWTPGEFVTAKIQTELNEVAIAVPLGAIQTIKGETVIFVAHGEEFIPSPVQIGRMDDTTAEIIAGLTMGDSYAVCNTFCLKADLQKEEVEHHH